MLTRRLTQLATAILAFAVASVVSPRAADANKRIAVLDVKGADESDLAESIEDIVGERCVVISGAKYLRAAKALGAPTLQPRDVRKVTAKIRADGVVRGWLQRDGDRYLLRVRLYEGASGEVVKKLAVRLNDQSLSRKLSRVLGKRLHAAIEELSPLRRERSYDDDDREDRRAAERRRRAEREREAEERREEERRREAEERREEERQRKAEEKREAERRRRMAERKREEERRRRAEEERRKREEEERLARLLPEDHEDRENPFATKSSKQKSKKAKAEKKNKKNKSKKKKKKKKTRTASRRDDDRYGEGYVEDDDKSDGDYSFEDDEDAISGASLSVGVSAVTRSLEFTSREGLANPPEGYSGPVVPSLLVAADVYPAALTNKKGAMAKLGVGFTLDRVFGLETAVGGVAAVTLPTTQMSYGMALKFRHRFPKAAYRPIVIASFGFQRLDFQVDKAAAPEGVVVDLPNTSYTYFYPGLEVQAQLEKRISATAEFKFPLVTGVGEMQEPEQYGAATITGFDVGLGAVYKLSSSVRLSGGVRWLSLGFDFKGTGEQAVNRDGDPATEDVAGALDRYLRGYLAASYRF